MGLEDQGNYLILQINVEDQGYERIVIKLAFTNFDVVNREKGVF